MATYIILNIVFMFIVVGILRIKITKLSRRYLVILGSVIILTVVFDSVIVWSGIVEYSTSKILGVRVGFAPIEDFCYPLLAVLIIPALWERFERKRS